MIFTGTRTKRLRKDKLKEEIKSLKEQVNILNNQVTILNFKVNQLEIERNKGLDVNELVDKLNGIY